MAIPGQYGSDYSDYVGLPDDDDLEPIALEYDDGDIGATDEPSATQPEASYSSDYSEYSDEEVLS